MKYLEIVYWKYYKFYQLTFPDYFFQKSGLGELPFNFYSF